MADGDVLSHAQIGEQAGMLMHDRDAVALGIERCRELDGVPIQQHLARVRAVDAGQELHAGALAGAILAQ